MFRPAVPHQIAAQYERWPYPNIPLIASIPSLDPWQLHLDFLRDRCGFGPAPVTPKIWIAGCGTQQPYVFSVANPRAKILASDRSETSLNVAKKRCWLHGHFGIEFSVIDLNEPQTWPTDRFDHIECYGVLMNLVDPAATLVALGERLAPGGILRIMVYPWYSRRRIFQVQRIAKLVGIHAKNANYPALFRRAMLALPVKHPLRYAVSTYADAQNDAGLVDGFLHAGDRGFTALELGQMIEAAGLTVGWWNHRPWAQPEAGLQFLLETQDSSYQTELLHQLDLWQQLRGNFTVCLVKRDSPAQIRTRKLHPLLSGVEGRGKWRAKLSRWLGWSLRSRTTEGPVRYTGSEVRALHRWVQQGGKPMPLVVRAIQDGVLLGEFDPSQLPVHRGGELDFQPKPLLEIGQGSANPLYGALFEAFRSAGQQLPAIMSRWEEFGDPLEEDGEFGLTPIGTWLSKHSEVEKWSRQVRPTALDWSSFRLKDEEIWFEEAYRWVVAQGLPKREWTEAERRELAVLIGSWRELCVDTYE